MKAEPTSTSLLAAAAFTAALMLILGCSGRRSPAATVAAGRPGEAPRAAVSEAETPAASAPAEAAAEAAPEAPKVYDNTIRWATASEVDNFGFDVFRSESEDGPFEKLNDRVVEGAGTVDEPQRYEFVDDTIDPRKTYYYYVESISMSGVRERFTPVGKAPPKIPSEKGEKDDAPPAADG